MPINSQYAWEQCSEAANSGSRIRIVTDDGAQFEGVPSHVDYDYMLIQYKGEKIGFALGGLKDVELLGESDE